MALPTVDWRKGRFIIHKEESSGWKRRRENGGQGHAKTMGTRRSVLRDTSWIGGRATGADRPPTPPHPTGSVSALHSCNIEKGIDFFPK